jgi:hypothetical protein
MIHSVLRAVMAGVPPQVLLGLGIVVVVVLSRLRARPVRSRAVVLPCVLIVVGLAMVIPVAAATPRLHPVDVVVVACDVVLSVTLGLARGASVRTWAENRVAWSRYTWVTVRLWAMSIVIRFALGVAGQHFGAAAVVTSGPILFFLGVTVLVQNLFVRNRASRL